MAVVGVSVDSRYDNWLLHKKLDLDYPLLYDKKIETIREYGVEHEGKDISLPATVLVDQEGRVRYIRVWPKKRARPDIDELLAAIDAAIAA